MIKQRLKVLTEDQKKKIREGVNKDFIRSVLKNCVFFDTETTGLLVAGCSKEAVQPEVIELGMLRVKDGEEVDSVDLLIEPKQKLSKKITEITGITQEMLKWKPKFSECTGTFKNFFEGAEYFIAHNAPFDIGILENEFKRLGLIQYETYKKLISSGIILDTCEELKTFLGFRPKLETLYKSFCDFSFIQTHRATDDARMIFHILKTLSKEEK